jgi:hypothetical protein
MPEITQAYVERRLGGEGIVDLRVVRTGESIKLPEKYVDEGFRDFFYGGTIHLYPKGTINEDSITVMLGDKVVFPVKGPI